MSREDSRRRAERARWLRGTGKTWQQIADSEGFRSRRAAQLAVKRLADAEPADDPIAARRTASDGLRIRLSDYLALHGTTAKKVVTDDARKAGVIDGGKDGALTLDDMATSLKVRRTRSRDAARRTLDVAAQVRVRLKVSWTAAARWPVTPPQSRQSRLEGSYLYTLARLAQLGLTWAYVLARLWASL